MNQQGTGALSFFSEDAWSAPVDGEGEIALALRAIDSGIGTGIHDDVGRNLAHRFTDLVGVCQVKRATVARDYFCGSCKSFEQGSPHLTISSGDENSRPHAQSKTSAVSSVAPFASLSDTIA